MHATALVLFVASLVMAISFSPAEFHPQSTCLERHVGEVGVTNKCCVPPAKLFCDPCLAGVPNCAEAAAAETCINDASCNPLPDANCIAETRKIDMKYCEMTGDSVPCTGTTKRRCVINTFVIKKKQFILCAQNNTSLCSLATDFDCN
jgi:hypothetical protein